MKYLRQFVHFDLDRFFAGKTLVVVSISDLNDHETRAIIGKRVTCAITRDDTIYVPGKAGAAGSNIYEKVNIKVKYPNTVSAAIGDEVTLINAVATVYGNYLDRLALVAEGLEVVHSPKNKR